MDNIVANLVRVGTVSSIDSAAKKARVIYKDRDIVSGWLSVLQAPIGGIVTGSAEGHSHDVNVDTWMPKINDTVLVLYVPVHNSDGYVLGVVK